MMVDKYLEEEQSQLPEKKWQALWEEVAAMVQANTAIDPDEPAALRRERIKQLEADPEVWFSYYFPAYAYAQPAGFHKEATKRVLENPEWYEVRLWSRELAKSTRTMMEVLYLALVGHSATNGAQRVKKKYVLLISNSLDNATRLLLPYKANLEHNKRIIQDYGEQYNKGNWQLSEFVTQQGAAFRALGAGQSPRGTRNEEARPDILLFDDVDTDAECMNRELVARKWHWIEEAAIGTRSVSVPTTIIFCGNRIAMDCCVARACRYADEVSEVNIRDARGHSTWPEKNSETDIDRVLSQKSHAGAQKEYFNNPVTEGSVFKQMAYKPARPLKEYDKLVCYTDPSYTDTGDYKATVLVGKWRDEYHVIKCYLDKTTTAQMIDWHFSVMKLVSGCKCSYHMESVFMQDVLMKEVHGAGLNEGMFLPLKEDNRRKPDKFTRIEGLLEPLNRNGRLYLNEWEKQNPHMERLAGQFLNFAAGSRAHDDGPDAVEGAIWMINTNMAAGEIVAATRAVNEKRY